MPQVTPSNIAFDPKTQLVHTTDENKIGITNNQRKVIASSIAKVYFDESTKNSANNDANAHILHKARKNNDSTLLKTHKISLGDIESLFRYDYINDIKSFCETGLIDPKNNDLLHLASYYGCEEVVDYLFTSGNCDNIDMKNDDGETALEIAVKKGKYSIVKNLLKRNVNTDNFQTSEYKIKFFTWAINNGECDLVKAPMSLTEINNILPALQIQSSSKQKHLCPNKLYFICNLVKNSGHSLETFFVENLELISNSVSFGKNTISPKTARTQLESIDNTSMLAIIKELVNNNFAIEKMIVKNIEQGNRNVILFLTKYDLLDHKNKVLALKTAFKCKNIQAAQLLDYSRNIIQHISRYPAYNHDVDIIEGMFYCNNHIPQILTKDTIECLTDIAIRDKNSELMKFLLKNENTSQFMIRSCVIANDLPDKLDEIFRNFLKDKTINDPIVLSVASPEILQILVENGADINTATPNNNTALSIACKFNRLEDIKRLIKNGAVVTPATIFSAYNAGNFHILTNYLIPNISATQYESKNDTSSQLVKQIIQERDETQKFLENCIELTRNDPIIQELKPLITGLKAELNIGNMERLSKIIDVIISKKNINHIKISHVRIDTAKNLNCFYRESNEMTLQFYIDIIGKDNRIISRREHVYFQKDINKGKDDEECLTNFITNLNADSIPDAIVVESNKNISDGNSTVYISSFNLIDGFIIISKHEKEVYIPITEEIYDYKHKTLHLDKLFPQDPQTTAALLENIVLAICESSQNKNIDSSQTNDDDELEKTLLSIHKPNTSNNLSESEQLVMINGVQTPLKKLIQNGELTLDLSKQLF